MTRYRNGAVKIEVMGVLLVGWFNYLVYVIVIYIVYDLMLSNLLKK